MHSEVFARKQTSKYRSSLTIVKVLVGKVIQGKVLKNNVSFKHSFVDVFRELSGKGDGTNLCAES